MTLLKYPNLAEHKKEHEAFVAKANDLVNQYKAGNTNISLATFTFLRDWLVKHIQGTDKNMVLPKFQRS